MTAFKDLPANVQKEIREKIAEDFDRQIRDGLLPRYIEQQREHYVDMVCGGMDWTEAKPN